jgi:hypothetical protein
MNEEEKGKGPMLITTKGWKSYILKLIDEAIPNSLEK